jgi:hypothetical protein
MRIIKNVWDSYGDNPYGSIATTRPIGTRAGLVEADFGFDRANGVGTVPLGSSPNRKGRLGTQSIGLTGRGNAASGEASRLS